MYKLKRLDMSCDSALIDGVDFHAVIGKHLVAREGWGSVFGDELWAGDGRMDRFGYCFESA